MSRILRNVLRNVCAHGQHDGCAAVGDPYDSEPLVENGRVVVWVCDCGCHDDPTEDPR